MRDVAAGICLAHKIVAFAYGNCVAVAVAERAVDGIGFTVGKRGLGEDVSVGITIKKNGRIAPTVPREYAYLGHFTRLDFARSLDRFFSLEFHANRPLAFHSPYTE